MSYWGQNSGFRLRPAMSAQQAQARYTPPQQVLRQTMPTMARPFQQQMARPVGLLGQMPQQSILQQQAPQVLAYRGGVPIYAGPTGGSSATVQMGAAQDPMQRANTVNRFDSNTATSNAALRGVINEYNQKIGTDSGFAALSQMTNGQLRSLGVPEFVDKYRPSYEQVIQGSLSSDPSKFWQQYARNFDSTDNAGRTQPIVGMVGNIPLRAVNSGRAGASPVFGSQYISNSADMAIAAKQYGLSSQELAALAASLKSSGFADKSSVVSDYASKLPGLLGG